MTLVPMVLDNTGGQERSYDLYSRLMKDRTIFFKGAVGQEMADLIVAQLLFLDSESDKPINMFIDSPGGSVYAGLGVYDTMNFIAAPVHTYVVGMAASMGSFIAQSGEPGHRYVLPNSTTMIHQPSSGSKGKISDMEIDFHESMRLKKLMTQLYVEHNSKGKTYEEFEKALDRDKWLSAQDAVDMGLADHIVKKKPRASQQ